MKTKILTFTALLLMAGSAFTGCEEDTPKGTDIPFTEYSFEGTESYWTSLVYALEKPILINSDEELKNYIVGANYPVIDFSKHTLVLAGGSTSTAVSLRTFRFLQFSTEKYLLNVELNWSDATIIGHWFVAILTDKLSNNSNVELAMNERP